MLTIEEKIILLFLKLFTMPFPTFVKGIIGTDPIIYDRKLHVAFIGRSNVGKSSLINMLLGEKRLVRSSSKPGHTRQINYFQVDNKTYYVDLPGYGFARMSKKEQEKIGKMISWYLFSAEIEKLLTIVIIDGKIGPQPADFDLLDELYRAEKPVIIALNKIDKVSKIDSQAFRDTLSDRYPNIPIFPVSAEIGTGRGDLRTAIMAAIESV